MAKFLGTMIEKMEISTVAREKKMAAIASVGSAIVLVSLKVFLTVATGSLGVLSEALHSSLDLIAAVITYLSVSVSDTPADERHPYGHGKFENFSAFVETALLLVTAVYIIWEAIMRLFFRDFSIHPSLLAVGLLGLALCVDLIRSRALGRVARKYASEALEADALHFSTDVWSTMTVMLGIAAVWIGDRFQIPWLRYADPIAALGVAGFVIWVGSRLGLRTLDALVDAAPPGLQEQISTAVSGMEGVLGAERVRLRRAGSRHFVDVTISVPRTASFERVHEISDAVERRVAQILPADVMVHMEPRARANEHLFEAIRAAAQRRNLAIHELSAQELEGRLFIEMHLEVEEGLTLRDAHRLASGLEGEVQQIAAGLKEAGARPAEVNIHIEPQGTEISRGARTAKEMKGLGAEVENFLNSLTAEYHELVDCHEVHVRQVGHKILVSCHCAMSGDLPITEVHDVTAALEDRVKEKFPQIARVTIHPEPIEER
jgi:cation diffusion facilitator family transporter